MFRQQLKIAVPVFLWLTLITGVLYPALVTWIAQTAFPVQANGSLTYRDTMLIGSSLIGQPFDGPGYLWGRPSATSPAGYNAALSSGSNLGPSNQALIGAVKARVRDMRAADPDNTLPVPVDLVTSSASGLDPHISLAAAYYQVPRIAAKRNMSEAAVKDIIRRNTTGRFLGFIGEPVVTVLKVNLDLDSLKK